MKRAFTLFAGLACAASVGVMPAAAAATDMDAKAPKLAISAAPSAKSASILGAPSALDAIRARQAGAAIQPAMLSTPSVAPARPTYRAAIQPRLRPAHASRPNIFNSVALAVSRTPFDDRFAAKRDARMGSAERKVAASLGLLDPLDAIRAVNAYVNSKVAFVSDSQMHGTEDRWSSAAETFRRGQGDCEDFALAKMQLLNAAGFDEDDLYFVILKDLVRRQDHAVLVVRHDDRFLVLDNGTDRLLDSDAVRDYKPVFTYAGGKSWIHGYQRPPAPVEPVPGFSKFAVAAFTGF